jgi:hypothetical protein
LWKATNLHSLFGIVKMAGMAKPNPEEVAKAFRKIAKDLGCDESEERFRNTLFTLGTLNIRDWPEPQRGWGRRRATDQNVN